MPALTVSPAQKILLQAMDSDLNKALGFGVNDGSSEFIAMMSGYEERMSATDKVLTREFLTSAAAAMLTSGVIGDTGGGGSVTSVSTGAGLTGGPITVAGTVSLDLTYSPTWTGDHLWNGGYVTVKGAPGDTNDIFLIKDEDGAQTAGCSAAGFLWGSDLWSDDAVFAQNLTITNSSYNGGEIGIIKNTVGTSSTYEAIRLSNTGTASGGSPRLFSPGLGMLGKAWDGAASRSSAWNIQNQPVNGGSITHKLSFWTAYEASQNAAPAFTIEEIQAGAFSITVGGVRIQPGSPSSNYALIYNGTAFVPTQISNSVLANSSLTVTAGAGLTGGGAISLGSSATLDVGAGTGITVNANDVAVDTTVVATTSNSLAMSNKTLTAPVISTGLTASGSASNNFSGSTGAFLTSTGAVSLAGSTTVLTTKTFSIADMTSGSIPFFGTSGLMSQDNSALTWDNSSKFMSVTSTGSGPLRLKTTSASAYNEVFFYDTSTTVKGVVGYGNASVAESARQSRFYLWAQTGVNIAFVGASNSEFGIIDTTNSRWGIGTMSPSHKLHVEDASASTSQIKIKNTNASAGVSQIEFFSSANASKLAIGYNNLGTDAYIYGQASTDFSIQINAGATKHIFKSGGQVGLGYVAAGSTAIGQHRAVIFQDITYPSDVTSSQLAVCGTTDPTKIMAIGVDTNAANGFGFIAAGKQGTAWTFLALQPSGGGVGIGTGTTSPAATLELKDASAGNLCALAMNAGQSATTSAASTGKLRYNASTNAFQMSENTGAYQDVVLLTKNQTLTTKTLTAPVINGLTSSGSTSIDFSGNSGTFKTTTGAVTIGNGAISVTGIATFSKFVAPNYAGTSTDFQTPTWTAVSYQNSYVDFGGAYGGSKYYKDALGQVHLRVAAKSGTATTTMFTLPAGFRPATQLLPQIQIDNTPGQTLIIATDGQVSCSPGGTTHALSGEIIFTAEA